MPYSNATTVSEMLTNYNGPNFHGILHASSPTDRPFTMLVVGAQGGLGNGAVQPVSSMSAPHREFEWQFYDLREPSPSRQRADGFQVSAVENRKRQQVKNVIQTHTEAYDVSFERMAQTEQFDGINANQGPNPVSDELGWQGQQALSQVALDQELSLLYSTYHLPGDNQTAARTRGIFEAITTNRVNAGGAKLSWDLLVEGYKSALDNGGAPLGEGLFLQANSDQIAQLSAEFQTKNLQPRTRSVYGVNVTTVITPFGPLNVQYNRHITQGQVGGFNATLLRTWHRWVASHDDVPGGVTFTYRLARTGNNTRRAIYSSIGLEYGLEKAHFAIDNLETSGS